MIHLRGGLAQPQNANNELCTPFSPVFVIIEYLAYTWYTLSYIPFARTAVLKFFGL